MTKVDFYFNAADRIDLARRLAAKVYRAGQKALLYCTDERVAAELDARIWTQERLSFLPHVRCNHPLATQTPILIGTDPNAMSAYDVLINLDADCPSCFSRFERVLEVVGTDQEDRQAGRQRYRFYKDRGYAIRDNDMTGK